MSECVCATAVVSLLRSPKSITLIRNQRANYRNTTSHHRPWCCVVQCVPPYRAGVSLECDNSEVPRAIAPSAVCVYTRSSGINLIYNHSRRYTPEYNQRAREKRQIARRSSANVRESVTFHLPAAVVVGRVCSEEPLRALVPPPRFLSVTRDQRTAPPLLST